MRVGQNIKQLVWGLMLAVAFSGCSWQQAMNIVDSHRIRVHPARHTRPVPIIADDGSRMGDDALSTDAAPPVFLVIRGKL